MTFEDVLTRHGWKCNAIGEWRKDGMPYCHIVFSGYVKTWQLNRFGKTDKVCFTTPETVQHLNRWLTDIEDNHA